MPTWKSFIPDLFSFTFACLNKRYNDKKRLLGIGNASKWMLCFVTASSWNKEILHVFMESIGYAVSGCVRCACRFMINPYWHHGSEENPKQTPSLSRPPCSASLVQCVSDSHTFSKSSADVVKTQALIQHVGAGPESLWPQETLGGCCCSEGTCCQQHSPRTHTNPYSHPLPHLFKLCLSTTKSHSPLLSFVLGRMWLCLPKRWISSPGSYLSLLPFLRPIDQTHCSEMSPTL